jgi:signal transduction histidine kinase
MAGGRDMRRNFVVSYEDCLLRPEERRRRLLHDLHDSVGPTVAAVALGLRAARNLLQRDQASAERLLARLEEELHGAIAEIRRLAHGAHPPVLDRLGLVAAVRQYAATLTSRLPGESGAAAAPRIEVEVVGEPPALLPAVEVAAYRIICEALTNVVRHSDARRCTVRIWLEGDLHVEIVDDGLGTAAAGGTAAVSGGLGLRSMRERARELGGEWMIGPADSGGTRVAASLPVGDG